MTLSVRFIIELDEMLDKTHKMIKRRDRMRAGSVLSDESSEIVGVGDGTK